MPRKHPSLVSTHLFSSPSLSSILIQLGRQLFHKNVYQKPPRIVNDDVWTFNSQSSSQWDGLRHFGYQKEKVFYNGVTLDDIHGENCTDVNGIGGMFFLLPL